MPSGAASAAKPVQISHLCQRRVLPSSLNVCIILIVELSTQSNAQRLKCRGTKPLSFVTFDRVRKDADSIPTNAFKCNKNNRREEMMKRKLKLSVTNIRRQTAAKKTFDLHALL